VRIDHFRGFESYWEIPANEATAIHGKWVKGPGKPFFDKMRKDLGQLPIMAEDLGIITPEVEKMRDSLGFPGMKILQFAFDSDENNGYLPHNYKTTNCVVYTGTHDNDTTLGWYLGDRVPYSSKERVERYGNCPDTQQIHWDFIRMAFSSVADIAIIPMQDILGFGSDCRMNIPSTAQGNWQWRCAEHFFTDEISARLRDETYFYGRGR
jgi:4-alpha-glucanotransferase